MLDIPSGFLATPATASDQLQGPGGTTWWVYLLAGAGIGGVVAAGVGLLGGRWQRGHELRLERIRNQMRLRDARRERLRDDFRRVVDITYVLDQAAMPAGGLAEATALKEAAEPDVVALRTKLDLDPAGTEIADQLADLVQLAWHYIVDARMATDLAGRESERAVEFAESGEQTRRKLQKALNELRERVRRTLQEIEGRPAG